MSYGGGGDDGAKELEGMVDQLGSWRGWGTGNNKLRGRGGNNVCGCKIK